VCNVCVVAGVVIYIQECGIYVYVYRHIRIHMYVYIYIYTHTCSVTHRYEHIYVYIYTCLFAYAQIYINMNTHIHVYKRTYMCIKGNYFSSLSFRLFLSLPRSLSLAFPVCFLLSHMFSLPLLSLSLGRNSVYSRRSRGVYILQEC